MRRYSSGLSLDQKLLGVKVTPVQLTYIQCRHATTRLTRLYFAPIIGGLQAIFPRGAEQADLKLCYSIFELLQNLYKLHHRLRKLRYLELECEQELKQFHRRHDRNYRRNLLSILAWILYCRLRFQSIRLGINGEQKRYVCTWYIHLLRIETAYSNCCLLDFIKAHDILQSHFSRWIHFGIQIISREADPSS